MTEFYDQENDIPEEMITANLGFLCGWYVANQCRFEQTVDAPFAYIDYVYAKHGAAMGKGYEKALQFYNRSDLDEPSSSDDWWAEFNSSTPIE